MTNLQNICISIVTYNPDISEFDRNIRNISSMGLHVIVVDNNSDNKTVINKILREELGKTGYTLVSNTENVGIAKALNQAFTIGEERGFKWVLTLDDDSIIPYNMIDSYIKLYEDSCVRHNIGIVCPFIVDKYTHQISSGKIDDNRCITSGSMTSIQSWSQVGGFDDYLFIDEVDFDFTRRIRQVGYEIIADPNVKMIHSIGNQESIKIFGKNIIVYNHSAVRKYYQARNLVYIHRKYGEFNAIKDFMHIIGKALKVIFFESDKINKVLAIVRGYCDGLKHEEIKA